MFEKEFQFFVTHQEELVGKYMGKVLVIVGDEVVGVYSDEWEAYLETQKRYELGTFMIQPCIPGPDAYTLSIASSEVFLA